MVAVAEVSVDIFLNTLHIKRLRNLVKAFEAIAHDYIEITCNGKENLADMQTLGRRAFFAKAFGKTFSESSREEGIG
jgi:hypothetical protein